MSFERHGRKGRDDISSFWVRPGTCSVCEKRGIVLRYRRVRGQHVVNLPEQAAYKMLTWRDLLRNPSSILRKAYRVNDGRYDWINPSAGALGVTCGCYGRFQRQLAHIADGTERRGV